METFSDMVGNGVCTRVGNAVGSFVGYNVGSFVGYEVGNGLGGGRGASVIRVIVGDDVLGDTVAGETDAVGDCVTSGMAYVGSGAPVASSAVSLSRIVGDVDGGEVNLKVLGLTEGGSSDDRKASPCWVDPSAFDISFPLSAINQMAKAVMTAISNIDITTITMYKSRKETDRLVVPLPKESSESGFNLLVA